MAAKKMVMSCCNLKTHNSMTYIYTMEVLYTRLHIFMSKSCGVNIITSRNSDIHEKPKFLIQYLHKVNLKGWMD